MIGILPIVFSIPHLPEVSAVAESAVFGRRRGHLTDVKVVGNVLRVTNFPNITGEPMPEQEGPRSPRRERSTLEFLEAEGPAPGKEAGVTGPGSIAEAIIVHIGCPLCREEFETFSTPGPNEAACPLCGLQFSFEGEMPAEPAAPKPRSDLDRWLAGEPIKCPQLSDRQRLWQGCRKRPYLCGLLAGSAVVVLAVAVIGAAGYCYTSTKLSRLDSRLEQTEQQRLGAESRVAEKTRLATEKQHQAETEMAARRSAEARLREAEAERLKAEEDRARAEQQQAGASREARIVLAEQLAQDSRRLLLAGRPSQSLFLASQSLQVQLQEGVTPSRITEQILRDALALTSQQGLAGHQGPVRAMAVSPNGRLLVTGSCDKTARVWDLWADDPAVSATVLRGHRDRISTLVISPDGRWLVTAGQDSSAILWDLTAAFPSVGHQDALPNGRSARPVFLRGHRGEVHALAISPDSRWLVTGDGAPGAEDHAGRLWDLGKDNPAEGVILLRGHDGPILASVISPDGSWVATAGEDATVRLWNLRARFPAAEQTVLRGHEGAVASLAVSPGGRWLVSGSHDGTARLWDLCATGQSRRPIVLRGHLGWIATVRISPDGRRLATGSLDKTVRLWDLSAADPSAKPQVLEGHTDQVRTVEFSPDARWLITGGLDKTVRLWDLAAEDPSEMQIILRGHASPIHTLVVSPDGRWLATGGGATCESNDSTVRLWDLRLESLLETARIASARNLSFPEQRRLLLEVGKRSEMRR